jgi:hypothetical protein
MKRNAKHAGKLEGKIALITIAGGEFAGLSAEAPSHVRSAHRPGDYFARCRSTKGTGGSGSHALDTN